MAMCFANCIAQPMSGMRRISILETYLDGEESVELRQARAHGRAGVGPFGQQGGEVGTHLKRRGR